MENATNGWAVDTIQNEGLEYAVRHYCDGSVFKDLTTGLLWDKAQRALDELVEYLQNETGRELD